MKIPLLLVDLDLNHRQPSWSLAGHALEEFLARMAVNVAVQNLWPINKVPHDDGGDITIVIDQVAFGVAVFGPKDLVEIRQVKLVIGGEGSHRRTSLIVLLERAISDYLDWLDHARKNRRQSTQRYSAMATPAFLKSKNAGNGANGSWN
jgi:hypothetical protein